MSETVPQSRLTHRSLPSGQLAGIIGFACSLRIHCRMCMSYFDCPCIRVPFTRWLEDTAPSASHHQHRSEVLPVCVFLINGSRVLLNLKCLEKPEESLLGGPREGPSPTHGSYLRSLIKTCEELCVLPVINISSVEDPQASKAITSFW